MEQLVLTNAGARKASTRQQEVALLAQVERQQLPMGRLPKTHVFALKGRRSNSSMYAPLVWRDSIALAT